MKFVLSEARRPFDPRVTVCRGDLADIALAGTVFVPHYAEAVPMRCAAPATMIRQQGGERHEAVSQLLQGETFRMFDRAGDWAWGQCAHDDYVGWVRADALRPADGARPITHLVATRAGLVFAEPKVRAARVSRLPTGAGVSALPVSENVPAAPKFVEVEGGFVPTAHLVAVDDPARRSAAAVVGLASELVGAPYLWGGRSGDALDCSGLVQLALAFAGLPAPRDTDQQQAALGTEIAFEERCAGDLLFLPGHVGIVADDSALLHATSHYMKLVREPIADVLARFRADDPAAAPVVKRLDLPG